MNSKQRMVCAIMTLALAGTWSVAGAAGQQAERRGAAQGETSQQKSQQGFDIPGSGSSNVILGGPEIIVGTIASLKGDELAIEGDRGQFMRLRMNKDTNMICSEAQGTKMTTGHEGSHEAGEIPYSAGTEQEMKRHASSGKPDEQRQALNDPNQQQAEHQMGPPTKDPSQLKDVVGSTDPKANQDVARGSGFVVGGSSGCQFKPGDHVRVEASDMGTVTSVKALSQSERSKIAGRADEPH